MVTRVISRFQQATQCSYFLPSSRTLHNMPKPKKQNASEKKIATADDYPKAAVFSDAKKNVVTIKVLAKPGSKCNGITDIGPDGVGVQIAAPPVDGEANTELIKYLSKILGLRKSDLSLDRGSKSKNKTVVVHASVAVEDILSKLQSEIDNG